MKKVLLPLIFVIPLVIPLQGQKEIPLWQPMLSTLGASYYPPLDAGYSPIKSLEEPYWGAHFSTFSRRDQIEIKFVLDTALLDYPTIQLGRWLAQIASNDAEGVISRVPIDPSILIQRYQADWGGLYFFKPKFSSTFYSECKLLALYKEGKGMIFIFFLFNEFTDRLQSLEHIISFDSLP